MYQALHLTIRGTVQGVGYRISMQRTGSRLGLTGWVRNRGDGSVEAVARGPEDALAELVAWAQHGPRHAIVESVVTTPWQGDLLVDGFEQIATLP